MLFLLTLYLQNVLGLTPLQAGFAFLPTALGVIAGAGLTSRLIARTGPRVPMTAGALMAAIDCFGSHPSPTTPSTPRLYWGHWSCSRWAWVKSSSRRAL